MKIERSHPVSGAKIGFKVDPAPYQAFKTVLEEEGFGKYVPRPRSDHSALVSSVASIKGKDQQLVPRKKSKTNGVELVQVEKHEHMPNGYTAEFRARVIGKRVCVDDAIYGSGPDEEKLTEEFLRTKAVLTTGAIGSALKEILTRELNGLPSMVDSRRIYLPEVHLSRWSELAARLFGRYDDEGSLVAEGICGGIYEIDRVEINAATIRQIRAALTERTTERAMKILIDVSKGTLNSEQLACRAEEGRDILAELKLYSEVLQETLDDLQKTAESVTGLAAAAAFADLAAA